MATDSDSDSDNKKRVRHGKTKRDHANGYPARRSANRDARNAYCQNSKTDNRAFPFHACNGHRNKYRVTGTGKQTVFLRDQVQTKQAKK